jgi:hypothetical protein
MSLGRAAIGVALLVRPELVTSAWIGKTAGKPVGRLLGRCLGARDLGVGLGVLTAYAKGAPARGWLAAGVVADATDLTATLVERDNLPGGAAPIIAALAGGGIVLGLVGIAAGDEPAPAP